MWVWFLTYLIKKSKQLFDAFSAVREKSPLRGSRTRGRNSPVVVENSTDESQENKRTTRSAKSKETKGKELNYSLAI